MPLPPLLPTATLRQSIESTDDPTRGSACDGASGLLNVAGALFPIDLERPSSVASVVHTALGLLMFLAYVLAVVRLRTGLRGDGRLARGRSAFTVCGAIGFLGILLTLGSSTWTGLGQRIFYLGFFGGLMALALPLLTNEGPRAASR